MRPAPPRTAELCQRRRMDRRAPTSPTARTSKPPSRGSRQDVGPVDFLANIAGWDVMRYFLETDPALWDKIIRINLYGPLHLHHVVLPGMVRRGFGRVVNVSSDAGRVGSSGEAVYSACKGGIIAFTKTMAREVARKGVTLNVLCPGPTDTPLFEHLQRRLARRRQDRRGDGARRAAEAHRASRTTTPAPSPSCCPTMPPTSPGRRSASPAA